MNKEDYACAKDLYGNLPILDSDRLKLRPMRLSDAPDIFEYAGDADVTHFLRWDAHPDIAATRRYVENVLKQYKAGDNGPWAIEQKTHRKVIGAIHIITCDFDNIKAEIGYVLSKEYWNMGFMTEALRELIRFCHYELGMSRVQGLAVTENLASSRVMEKAGMIHEGTLRNYLYQKNRHWDARMYSIIR